jgi:AraC-like DNA-binding protein
MHKNNGVFQNRELVEGGHLLLDNDKKKKYGFYIFNVNVEDGPRDDYRTAPVRRFNCWCLSHVFAGKGACDLEGRGHFEIFPGSAVLVAPGERNVVGGLPRSGYREDYIMFGGPLFENLHDVGLLESGCCSLGVGRRLPMLAELLYNPMAESYWRCGIMLQELLLEFRNILHTPSNAIPIANLLKEIQNRPESWWPLEEIAERCHRSPAQTRRIFLRYTGMTPKAYVEKVKFQRAKELLINTSNSIEEIAQMLGFRNRFHFSRRFKAIIGFPPAYFRQHSFLKNDGVQPKNTL